MWRHEIRALSRGKADVALDGRAVGRAVVPGQLVVDERVHLGPVDEQTQHERVRRGFELDRVPGHRAGEAAVTLLEPDQVRADRVASRSGCVSPTGPRPHVAGCFEPQRPVSDHALPLRRGAERQSHARRLDVAARRDAVDAGRAEVEAAGAEQRVEPVDPRVRRILVAGRAVVLEQQVRRARSVELIADLEVQERRAVVEIAARDAAHGAAGLAVLERGLDLVVPL